MTIITQLRTQLHQMGSTMVKAGFKCVELNRRERSVFHGCDPWTGTWTCHVRKEIESDFVRFWQVDAGQDSSGMNVVKTFGFSITGHQSDNPIITPSIQIKLVGRIGTNKKKSIVISSITMPDLNKQQFKDFIKAFNKEMDGQVINIDTITKWFSTHALAAKLAVILEDNFSKSEMSELVKACSEYKNGR